MEHSMTIGTDQAPARSLIEIEAEIMAQKRTIGRSIVVIGQGRITGIVDARTTTKEEIGLLMTKKAEGGRNDE